jgi:hypothetical protein
MSHAHGNQYRHEQSPPNKVADKTDSSPVIKKKKTNKDEIITKTTNKELATKKL